MTNRMMLKNEKTLVRRIAAYVREAVVGGVLAAPRLRRACASGLDKPSIVPSAVAAGLATCRSCPLPWRSCLRILRPRGVGRIGGGVLNPSDASGQPGQPMV